MPVSAVAAPLSGGKELSSPRVYGMERVARERCGGRALDDLAART